MKRDEAFAWIVIAGLIAFVAMSCVACAALRAYPSWMPREPLETTDLQLIVYPSVTFPGREIRIYPCAARHPLNRWIVIEVVEVGFGRVDSHVYQVNGEYSSIVFPDWWIRAGLPGEYLVIATLQRADGSVVSRTAPLNVAGGVGASASRLPPPLSSTFAIRHRENVQLGNSSTPHAELDRDTKGRV